MSDLLSVALVCAGTLLAQDCSRDTALDIIVSPAHSPMECLMHAQILAAQAPARRRRPLPQDRLRASPDRGRAGPVAAPRLVRRAELPPGRMFR